MCLSVLVAAVGVVIIIIIIYNIYLRCLYSAIVS